MTELQATTTVETTASPRPFPALREAVAHLLVFLGQRLLFWLVILLAIIFLTYFGLLMINGAAMSTAVPEAAASTVQYIGRLLQGELGMSSAGSSTVNPLPVSEVVAERLPRSLGLLGISLLLASLAGVILGLRAARGNNQRSLGIILSTLIGISIPSFFAAFLLQWAVTSYTRVAGRAVLPVGGFGWDAHLVLPMLVLAARPLAQIARISFVTLRDVLRQDYVRTAQSKGLRPRQITAIHVMRNAAIPILTTIGVSFRFALSSLAIVELYFGWPGAGQLLLKSISQADENLTVALVLCFGIVIMIVNLLLELSYRLIDPRLWESPAYVGVGGGVSWHGRLRGWGESARDWLADNALAQRLRRRAAEAPSPFQRSLDRLGGDESLDEPYQGKRSIWTAVRTNPAFTIGGILVFTLLLFIFIGPLISPHNPYTTRGLEWIDGELTPPPFAPNDTYPWGTDALGRDMMSLILAGIQQTLSLAILAVLARLIVGVVLGALAGWQNGSRLDQAITGLAEIIAAFPTLLLAMILILALGIRQGMTTFIIALCFVGWGEIMQFVRGEVTAVRPKAFIESAVASGARTSRIFNRHIMPVLFGSLISLTALEMSAVLMLLGELGFISIFIGGGAFIELSGVGVFLYSDVPEWGALLSNVRYYARPYPWTALYPMLAFFGTIFAFNLFGEGVRRAVDEGNLVINRFVNRYTMAAAVVFFLGYRWLDANSGGIPFFQEQARLFASEQVMAHVDALTAPEMDGRALGSDGQALAAQYIADQFAALGVQAAGEKNTYFQNRFHSFGRLLAEPEFAIHDGGSPLSFGTDFTIFPGRSLSDGEVESPVRVIGLGQPTSGGYFFRFNYPALDRADFSDEIVMVMSEREAALMRNVPRAGLLVVTDDPARMGQRFTMPGRSQVYLSFTGQERGGDTPSFWITEEVAGRLLASAGLTVDEVQEQIEALPLEDMMQIELPLAVTMKAEGELVERHPVQHVLGYLPGRSGYQGCTDCLGEQLLIVMAQYDTPPLGPDGTAVPGAIDNASGVAVMLEAIRVLQAADFQPNRSYMFIAYSGEGLDGGNEVNNPDVTRFMQAKTGFLRGFKPEAIIQLRGLGGQNGDHLEIYSAGSLRLANVFEIAAGRMGANPVRGEETIDISLIYEDVNPTGQSSQAAPVVQLFGEDWEAWARTAVDTPDQLSPENIERAGRALSMALMLLGQERKY